MYKSRWTRCPTHKPLISKLEPIYENLPYIATYYNIKMENRTDDSLQVTVFGKRNLSYSSIDPPGWTFITEQQFTVDRHHTITMNGKRLNDPLIRIWRESIQQTILLRLCQDKNAVNAGHARETWDFYVTDLDASFSNPVAIKNGISINKDPSGLGYDKFDTCVSDFFNEYYDDDKVYTKYYESISRWPPNPDSSSEGRKIFFNNSSFQHKAKFLSI